MKNMLHSPVDVTNILPVAQTSFLPTLTDIFVSILKRSSQHLNLFKINSIIFVTELNQILNLYLE